MGCHTCCSAKKDMEKMGWGEVRTMVSVPTENGPWLHHPCGTWASDPHDHTEDITLQKHYTSVTSSMPHTERSHCTCMHACTHLQTINATSFFQLSNYLTTKTLQSSAKLVRSWEVIHPSSIFGSENQLCTLGMMVSQPCIFYSHPNLC